MDISTSLGLMAGMMVMAALIFMGGDLRMFVDYHAAIVIFGGSFAATLIRFPLSSIFHGLPLGAKYAFTLRRMSQRELVEELAGLAEIARKQGPVGLEKVEVEDAFLAKGIRFIADGYDNSFIRDNLERDRDNFLTHLDEGQKIYRAIGDCAPAFGMIGTLIGMVQMFANMTDPSKLGPFMAVAGVIEMPGLPTRPKLKNAAPIPPEEASANPTEDQRGNQQNQGGKFDNDRNFALAAASLRQALQDMPEISEVSKNIIIEETKQGLNIEIVDQNGRSMFPEGSKEPYERTRQLIRRLAGSLRSMPFRISIAGHTSASKLPPPANYGPWELSADRANAIRKQLETEGVPSANFFMVAGRADTQPLFPDDPYIAANRRVTITLMREEPPIPQNMQP